MLLRLASALVAVAVLLPAAAAAQQGAPRARVVPTFDTLHGDVRRDDYFWMRDRNNPETIAYLEAENAWTAEQMRGTEQLQETLYEEIVGRIKQTDLSVPFRLNGYWYYSRTEQGKNYPIYCRKRGSLDAPEEIVLDQNVLAAGRAFHALGGWQISPDGNYVAYLEDTTALRWNTLRIKDLRTGQLLPDVVDSVTGGPEWANDNATIFYVRADSARRDNRVMRHTIGATGADPVVVQEDDLLFSVNVDRLRSGRFLAISYFSFTSTEVRVVDADRPTETPRLIEPRRADVEYTVDHHGDRFLILTNDGAPNFRIMSAPENAAGRANWTEWLPYDPAVFTERIAAYRDFVVLSQRIAGLRTLNVVDATSKRVRAVRMPEKAYGVSLAGTPDYDSDTFRYNYSSFVTPPSVYEHDVRMHRSELQKAEQIKGFDRTRYGVERFEVRARDGAMVPVSIVYRKPLVKNGRNPLLLYAYGSYGATMEPTFNPSLVSLLDRGVVYVLAHIRGGQEKGRAWYDDGKMLKKKNTFHDFIDVADHLVKEKWTSPEKLVANGGSAGGLLMGVVVNMRPDLFRAVVADVPFVDVINTMRDASIPLTAAEWVQWGNPIASEEEYRYMLSYSPYDNVEAKDYPWLLVTTSLNDSQVAYWEPAKWTAKLRTLKTDANPLLLKTNMAGGHGGSSGRYARWKETAFRMAFMLKALGMAPEATP